MLKFFKISHNPQLNMLLHWFLADSIGHAKQIAKPYDVRCAGPATQDELAHWMALCENDEPLDYVTWQKVTEVPPPVNQPIWTRNKWDDYASFTFNNLDDCQGCLDTWWLPIAGHDYGVAESKDEADGKACHDLLEFSRSVRREQKLGDDPELKLEGGTPISMHDLGQVAEDTHKFLNPPTLKPGDKVTFELDGKIETGVINEGAEGEHYYRVDFGTYLGKFTHLHASRFTPIDPDDLTLKHSVGQKVCFYSEGVRVEGVVFMLEKPIGLGLPFYIIKTSNGRRFEAYEEGVEACDEL